MLIFLFYQAIDLLRPQVLTSLSRLWFQCQLHFQILVVLVVLVSVPCVLPSSIWYLDGDLSHSSVLEVYGMLLLGRSMNAQLAAELQIHNELNVAAFLSPILSVTSLVLSDSLRDFPFQSSRQKHGSIFILICHTPFQVYQCLGSSSRRKEKKNRILSFPGGSQLLQLVRKVFFIRVLGSCGPSLLFLLVAPLALDCLEARV